MQKTVLLALFLSVSLVPVAAADDPVACPERSVTIGQYETHTVTTHADCTVDIVLNEGIICLGGGVGKTETVVGPIHVTQYYCTWPGFPPEIWTTSGGTDVFLPPLMGWTWSGSYKPLVSAHSVTVWAYSCDPET